MPAVSIRQKKLLEENSALKNVLREIQHLIAPFIDINANETSGAVVIIENDLTPQRRQQPVESITGNERGTSPMDVLQYLRLQKKPTPDEWPAQTQAQSKKPFDLVRKREQVKIVLDRLTPQEIEKIQRKSQTAIRKRPNTTDQPKQRPGKTPAREQPMPQESQRQRYPRMAAPTNLAEPKLRNKIVKKMR